MELPHASGFGHVHNLRSGKHVPRTTDHLQLYGDKSEETKRSANLVHGPDRSGEARSLGRGLSVAVFCYSMFICAFICSLYTFVAL